MGILFAQVQLSESDALAIAMVAVLGFVLSLLLSLLLIINRHASKVDHSVEDIDLEAEERKLDEEIKRQGETQRAPWERDPDWWKAP